MITEESSAFAVQEEIAQEISEKCRRGSRNIPEMTINGGTKLGRYEIR